MPPSHSGLRRSPGSALPRSASQRHVLGGHVLHLQGLLREGRHDVLFWLSCSSPTTAHVSAFRRLYAKEHVIDGSAPAATVLHPGAAEGAAFATGQHQLATALAERSEPYALIVLAPPDEASALAALALWRKHAATTPLVLVRPQVGPPGVALRLALECARLQGAPFAELTFDPLWRALRAAARPFLAPSLPFPR